MIKQVERVALRMDDVGASSKRYEVYSDRVWNLGNLRVSGNWLFLKFLPPFRKWGPYREMQVGEWCQVLDLLEAEDAKLTVGVTASWVVSDRVQVPFPQRFPAEAAVLKEGVEQGLLEIANHGLTHCVVEGNVFKPKWFAGNRQQHREFFDWLPAEGHKEHIRKSQEILQSYFEVEIVTLVPPGNVYTRSTLEAARQHGIRVLSCSRMDVAIDGIAMIHPRAVVAFHDRELVLEGIDWLRKLLSEHRGQEKVFVRELAIRKPD